MQKSVPPAAPAASAAVENPAPAVSPPPHTGRRVLVNTSALTTASLWRIGMSLILQLLIARRLGPEGLGHYTIALAYLNVSQVVSELGLPTLLVRDLAQQPTHRRSYFRSLLMIQVVASLLTWAGLIALSFVLPYGPVTQMSLWLVGASLPLYALTSASQTLFQAGERMELVMGVEVFINTLILAVSVAVLWAGGAEIALVAVLVATQAVSAALCLLLLFRTHLLKAPQEQVAVPVPPLLHKAMPFFGLSLGDVLLQRLDILLLSIVAGPAVTGIYSAAYNLVRVCMKLVQSFWRALYPTLSRLHRQSQVQYDRLARLGLRYGLMVLLPMATIGMGVASGLLHLMFGGDYTSSARVFQVLIWATPLFLIENYAITLLMIEHDPRHSLVIMGLHLTATIIFLPPLAQVDGADGAAWAVVLAGAVGAGYGVWLLHRLQLPLYVRRFWGMALAAVIAGAISLLLPANWLVRGAVGGIAYSLLLWVTGVLSPADLSTLFRTLRGNPAD